MATYVPYKNLSGITDADSKFFWTCEAFEQTKSKDFTNFVPITTPSKAVYKDFAVMYAVRIWETKNNGTIEPMYDNDGFEVLIRDSWRQEVKDQVTIGDIVQGSSIATYNGLVYNRKKPGDDNDQSTKEVFRFTLLAKKSNVTVTPQIYVKLKKNSSKNPGALDLEVLPKDPSTTPDPNYNCQTIKFTAARVDTDIPESVKKQAWNQSYITKDKCSNPNVWVTIVRTGNLNPLLVDYHLRRFSLDGLQCTFHGYIGNSDFQGVPADGVGKLGPDEYIGSDLDTTKPENVNRDFKGSDKRDSKTDAIKALLAIKTNSCGPTVEITTPDTDTPFVDSKPITVSDSQINPPSHYYTRDISLWNKIRGQAIKDLTGSKSIEEVNRIDILTKDAGVAGRLGMIFQDEASATALNKSENSKKPWGFRFTYNPSSFSYNSAMDTSIDWMLSTKDPANYVGGNVSVGFQLYLNRVADMTELAYLRGKEKTHTKNYPKTLTVEAVQGILYRGTEYDLEYLYRVLNGDPYPSNNGLLTYTVGGKPAITSDFGYITGTPIWLRLHDNLRYKGSISSISVNHVLFNEFMVPMFSTVDITMVRYPIIGDAGKDAQDGFDKKKTKYLAAVEAANEPSTDKTATGGVGP